MASSSKAAREFSAVSQLREGMNDEVAYYDEELTELIQNIEDGVDGLHKKRQAARAEVRSPADPGPCCALAGAPQPPRLRDAGDSNAR